MFSYIAVYKTMFTGKQCKGQVMLSKEVGEAEWKAGHHREEGVLQLSNKPYTDNLPRGNPFLCPVHAGIGSSSLKPDPERGQEVEKVDEWCIEFHYAENYCFQKGKY